MLILKKQFMKCSVGDDVEVERINNMLLEKLDLQHMKNAKVTPIKDVITKTKHKPVIVFDVEHTGCSETLVLQRSWGLYQHDGTLIHMKGYYLKPEGDMHTYRCTHTFIHIYIFVLSLERFWKISFTNINSSNDNHL